MRNAGFDSPPVACMNVVCVCGHACGMLEVVARHIDYIISTTDHSLQGIIPVRDESIDAAG